MEEVDHIMASVQAIFELVQGELGTAAETMTDGRWTGLSADARMILATKAREEVNKLKPIFDRVKQSLDTLPGCQLTPSELEARIEAKKLQLANLK